jgi:DNA-binding NtrC family response regulator
MEELSKQVERTCEEIELGSAETANELFSEAARLIWTAINRRGMPYNEAMRRLERTVLETVIAESGQTRREIAGRLNTSERTLYHKLRSHNLTQRPARQPGALHFPASPLQ